MNIVSALLAVEDQPLPPFTTFGYEYVIASNGLLIRAEDARMEALIPVAPARLYRLADVEPYARLKVPHVPQSFLWSVLASATRHLPNEAMYQFLYEESGWRCMRPTQTATPTTIDFDDTPEAVVDLHSHNVMPAFFSQHGDHADDSDEQGFRFYAVIGRLDTPKPEIAVRIGVYGHRWPVPATAVFDATGPFVDTFGADEFSEL